jgi:hypothetical protein
MRALTGVVCILALGTSALSLPHPTHPAQQSRERLARLAPLVGGTWVSEGEAPGIGRYTARRTHEWALDSSFLRVRQTMSFDTATIEEEMLIGWDPAEGRIHTWSFASDGSHSEGYEVPGEDTRRWVTEGRTVGGRGGEWRITLFLFDVDAFSLLLEVRSARAFIPGLTLAFRRQH